MVVTGVVFYFVGPGIFHGFVDVSGSAGQDSVTADTKLITYPYEAEEQPSKPLDIVLTEFHVLVLFRNRSCLAALKLKY